MKATWLAMVLSSTLVVVHVYALPQSTASKPLITEQSLKKIDLNQADVETLTQSFKGIGSKRAQAIVAYREKNGLFKSVAELAYVRGIGQRFVDKNLEKLQGVFMIK